MKNKIITPRGQNRTKPKTARAIHIGVGRSYVVDDCMSYSFTCVLLGPIPQPVFTQARDSVLNSLVANEVKSVTKR